MKRLEEADLSDMLSKKRASCKEALFLLLVKTYFLFTLVIYFCRAIVIEGVSGVGA